MTLEELSRDARVTGIVPDGPVTILDVRRHGEGAAQVTYRTGDGRVDHALLFRHQEPGLALAPRGDAWTFDADGRLFRLAAEASVNYELKELLSRAVRPPECRGLASG